MFNNLFHEQIIINHQCCTALAVNNTLTVNNCSFIISIIHYYCKYEILYFYTIRNNYILINQSSWQLIAWVAMAHRCAAGKGQVLSAQRATKSPCAECALALRKKVGSLARNEEQNPVVQNAPGPKIFWNSPISFLKPHFRLLLNFININTWKVLVHEKFGTNGVTKQKRHGHGNFGAFSKQNVS